MKNLKNIIVIINESHKLLKIQNRKLDEKFGRKNWNIFPVPSKGWTIKEQKILVEQWENEPEKTIIFISPVPYLLALVACAAENYRAAQNYHGWYEPSHIRLFLFVNDKRKKTELPDGRVIYKLLEKGWQLKEV